MRLPEEEIDAMPKKRSLKDVAAAPLVKKAEVLSPEAGVLGKTASRAPAPRKRSRQRIGKSPIISAERLDGAVSTDVVKRSVHGSLARTAASILIGFLGGYFFGRFIKII
jgi:hypothetical protein